MTHLPLSQVTHNIMDTGLVGWDIHEHAAARAANGEDVHLLTIGDPDFQTPEHISSSLLGSLEHHRTHYSNPRGEYQLRRSLAELEATHTGKAFSVEQFNIFNGATNALYSTLRCIANQGNNVVIIEPYYIGYRPILTAAGTLPKVCSAVGSDFKVEANAIENAIDNNTVAVLLNTPVNPTGHVVSPETMRTIYQICRARNIWLICDEVYSLVTFEKPHHSMLEIADNLENVVVIDSLSKSHAMTGWRVGWTATNEHLSNIIARFALASFFSCNQFVQDAAVSALRGGNHQVERMRGEYQRRRDYTLSRIAKIDRIDAVEPEAGMFVMANVHQDGYQFARRMVDEIGVSVAPGFAAGKIAQNHVRISYGVSIEKLEKAWDRIEIWMNNCHQDLISQYAPAVQSHESIPATLG